MLTGAPGHGVHHYPTRKGLQSPQNTGHSSLQPDHRRALTLLQSPFFSNFPLLSQKAVLNSNPLFSNIRQFDEGEDEENLEEVFVLYLHFTPPLPTLD